MIRFEEHMPLWEETVPFWRLLSWLQWHEVKINFPPPHKSFCFIVRIFFFWQATLASLSNDARRLDEMDGTPLPFASWTRGNVPSWLRAGIKSPRRTWVRFFAKSCGLASKRTCEITPLASTFPHFPETMERRWGCLVPFWLSQIQYASFECKGSLLEMKCLSLYCFELLYFILFF